MFRYLHYFVKSHYYKGVIYMPTPVKMPRLGESVAEGTVGSWLKKEGDWVERDESLAEIITDKINAELPSPVGGRLEKISIEVAETVRVGADIGLIEETADVSASPPAEAVPGPGAVPVESPARANVAVMDSKRAGDGNGSSAAVQISRAGEEERQRISPLARRLAREHGLDLNAIPGTGTGGRVRKEDILAYLAQQEEAPVAVGAQFIEAATPVPAAQPAYTAPAAVPVAPPYVAPAAPPLAGEDVEIVTPSRMRLAIAEHMGRSKRTSPHPTTVMELDMTNIPN